MSDLKVKLTLNDVQAEDKQPNIALFLIEKGRPSKKISIAKNAEIKIPSSLTKKANTIAFGPDVDNFEELNPEFLLQFNSQQIIPELEKNPLLDIPRLRWLPWLRVKVCVSGKAQKCFFPFFPRPIQTPTISSLAARAIPSANIAARNVLDLLSPPILQRCLPLCHGVVEVYERTCCCNIWDILPRIPDLIPELVIPEKFPIPDPSPIFNNVVRPTINIPKNILRSQTIKNPVESVASVNLDGRTVDDLKTLLSIGSQEKQFEFIDQRPYLIPVLCRSMSCSVKKVGETNIGKDGKFSLCYRKPFTLTLPVRRRCYTTYFYRVRQWIGGSYVYVYEGAMAKQYFNRDEEANLTTFHAAAETCEAYEPPVEGQGEAYVMLQDIGNTESYKLKSPPQTSATGINEGLVDNDGLLNFAGVEDCPLAKTLNLRLYIDPDLASTNVTYYRFSIVKANSNGMPDGTPVILNQPIAWSKFVNGVFPPKIEAEVLGPLLVNNVEGLYKIPYVNSDNEWLGGQYHYALNTLTQMEGTHLLILELFDENGDKVKPENAAGAGAEKGFHFLKWRDTEDTDNIPFAALIHAIQINNTSCVASIEDLRKTGDNPNIDDCQFISSDDGTGAALFSAGFRAYHEAGFMHNYTLDYRKGLKGSDVIFEEGFDNKPPGFTDPNAAAMSNEVAFSEMLETNTVGAKCTFALDLYVNAKHTNGSGFIDQYDASDQASFALEITDVPPPQTT